MDLTNEKIELFDKYKLDKFHIDVLTVMVKCRKCNHVWVADCPWTGVQVNTLVCRFCAQKEVAERIKEEI